MTTTTTSPPVPAKQVDSDPLVLLFQIQSGKRKADWQSGQSTWNARSAGVAHDIAQIVVNAFHDTKRKPPDGIISLSVKWPHELAEVPGELRALLKEKLTRVVLDTVMTEDATEGARSGSFSLQGRSEELITGRVEFSKGNEQAKGERESAAATVKALGSANPEELERACFVAAYGTPRVAPSLVPRLEAALDHDSPIVLGLVLTALGRAAFENAGVTIQRQDRVRELAAHEDSRVAFAAQNLLAVSQKKLVSPAPEPRTITSDKAAKRLKLSKTRLMQLANEGRLGKKVGRQWLFTDSEINHFADAERPVGIHRKLSGE